ncbi:Crt homolog 2 [Geodia barretti]|nr:Crt homolog 2 [Geodia barretti]CAI8027750.1 Crt homolog 2 [Geodia barretti]
MGKVAILESLKKHKELLIAVNVLFAALSISGQVGVNVTLPLWTSAATASCQHGASNSSNSTNGTTGDGLSMDPFFVLSSSSFAFMVIYGVLALVSAAFGAVTMDDLRFPQWQLFLIGFFSALNGVLIVYSSPTTRTPPFLQAILGNFLIPITIIFRLILLRKRPQLIKLMCAVVVFLGLVLSLIPVITGMDASDNSSYLNQNSAARILWPLCFMLGYVPAALMNVIEEKSLKDKRNVNMFFLLFCSSSYQLISAFAFFWTDLIPHFGYTNNIHEFGENYKYALSCFFGGSGCTYVPGLRGSVFVVMFTISLFGGGLLLRYAEGATYLAVVNAVVTPLGALFWSLFQTDDCGAFFLGPHANSLTYFSIPGLLLMVPAIFIYNLMVSEVDPLERFLKKLVGLR